MVAVRGCHHRGRGERGGSVGVGVGVGVGAIGCDGEWHPHATRTAALLGAT